MAQPEQASAAQFCAIAQLQGGVAFIIDLRSGRLIFASDCAERVLGYSAADIAAHLDGSAVDVALQALTAGLPERVARHAGGDVSRERVVRHHDLRRKDGTIVPVEIISQLMEGALVGVAHDISARRAREAEQKRFASMLNHEFRTPLSTIDGAIQRLEATAPPQLDSATRERYRKIQGAVDRLIGMLDDYLSPDRGGASRGGAYCEPLDLIREAAAGARTLGRHVEIDAAGLPARLRCEPGALRLALQVLVDNAVRYSPSGTALSITGRRTASGIEIDVGDDGPGLDQDELPRLFEKAFRGRNAAGTSGAGMGLYMAKTVVEAHGGFLSGANRAHCGAMFRIALPIRDGLPIT